MEWIKSILPLLGVLLGWGLSESGKIFADKRQDKRKLKKLLYYLLELRFHFTRELSLEIDFDNIFSKMKVKLEDKLGVKMTEEELISSIEIWKPIIQELLLLSKPQNNKFEFLENNIENVLNELAENFPILAYELSGQHNIKERLNRVEKYFDQAQQFTNDMPFDIAGWMQPKLTTDLLKDLDEGLYRIADKIGGNTIKIVGEKIKRMEIETDNNEMDLLMDEYLDKIKDSKN